ncbi:hypothetical protein F5Y15DRAFT_395157 [Xylariaceae sp. FL0016]|nr:hypothetical protein F5Y15DRAFT_395157 [Xylariaceae sp. FL0016]
MVVLSDLPPEILHHILAYVDPHDLAWIPGTCRQFYHAVTGNSALFKLVYLNHLDKPPKNDVNFEQALKDVVRLQVICRRESPKAKKQEINYVHDVVTTMLKNAAGATSNGDRPFASATFPRSRNASLLSEIFKKESNQAAFLCRSLIYERARAEWEADKRIPGPPRPENQKSAHLHCLYGVPLLLAYPTAHRHTRSHKMTPFACSKVYDLRQYTEKTRWGPFMDDDTGNVDWEKVEAIMLVLGANLIKLHLDQFPICRVFCQSPFAGTWPGSYNALPRVDKPEGLELADPYGVTGTWMRVVCFLDYTDFYEFNFANVEPASHIPRPALHAGEATRLILMRITVTKIEPPGPEDGQALPVVHFSGISRSLDDSFDENANSDLRGTVRLTREGEVRWTTFSVFSGMERWRSESVQIGGVRSAKGVLGNWFDKDYDPRGPAGPTAFWKISDKTASGNGAYDLGPIIAELDETDGDFEPSDFEDEESELPDIFEALVE